MVRPEIWSGLSSETRHAQCIKPERVLSLYGPTIGTRLQAPVVQQSEGARCTVVTQCKHMGHALVTDNEPRADCT